MLKSSFKYWIKINIVIFVLMVLGLILGRSWFFRNEDWVFWVLVLIIQAHLVEEFFFPNRFIYWFNIHVCRSKVRHKPLTRKSAIVLNILTPVVFIISALIGTNIYGLFVIIPLSGIWMMFHNAWFHLTFTILHKGSLGTLTSFFLIIPFTFYSIYMLHAREVIGIEEVIISFVTGGICNYFVFAVMRITQASFKKRSMKRLSNTD